MDIMQLTLFESNIDSAKKEGTNFCDNEVKRNRLEAKYKNKLHENLKIGTLVSYQGNKKLPILRLYKYKEAFSYQFVKDSFHEYKISQKDYVFDPFCGSGTTLISALRLGRKWFGCELEPKYVEIANKRIEAERNQLKLF